MATRKQLILIDKNARILMDSRNYILEFRRNSKKQISWRLGGYFPDLTSLYLEYLNSSPRRAENAINSIEELVQVIKKAEARICKIINNN
jgi:hypothetical protein